MENAQPAAVLPVPIRTPLASMSLRDGQVVTGRPRTIPQHHPREDFLRAPSFVRSVKTQENRAGLAHRKWEFFSRVRLPRTTVKQGGPGPSMIKVSHNLVGPQLDEALAAGRDLIMSWPLLELRFRIWHKRRRYGEYLPWRVRPFSCVFQPGDTRSLPPSVSAASGGISWLIIHLP